MKTTASAHGYTATLIGDRVRIYDAHGHLATEGVWRGRIVDAPGDLGDDAYDALDAALISAGAEVPCECGGTGERTDVRPTATETKGAAA